MAGELAEHVKAMLLGGALDRGADVGERHAGLSVADSRGQRRAGGVDELASLLVDGSDRDRDRRVGVIAVDLGGDVERTSSPGSSTRLPGTPWTTCSSTLMQIDPG